MRRAAVVVLLASLAAVPALGQTVQLSRVMEQKLLVSQQLLAALVTSDWDMLAERGRELERLTRGLAWGVMNAPEYARDAGAFLGATQDLIEAAERHDLDATPLAYVQLTLSCVRCHQSVARARMAKQAFESFESFDATEPLASLGFAAAPVAAHNRR